VCQRKDTDYVMSNDAVSFLYVSPGQMYMFDYLLYRLNRHWPSSTAADRRYVLNSSVLTDPKASLTQVAVIATGNQNQTSRRQAYIASIIRPQLN